MTTDQIKATLATLDTAMKTAAVVCPADQPSISRRGCTCATCKPQGGRR